MHRKRKILLALLAVILMAAVLVIFQREMRIAYHKNRLWAADTFFTVGQETGPKIKPVDEMLIRLGRGTYEHEIAARNKHIQSLLDLGYLVRAEIPLQNRLYVSGTNRAMFRNLIAERIDFGKAAATAHDWWDTTSSQSNKIIITTTVAQMPKWKKLVEDFDHP